ncbi:MULTISPECIES: glycosyltransferase family 2 protein [unclassified Ensifer]|uniref:glycosyltransferase family 2 protein n=1 Tax=unclassified Ensifer TaxID=2633371 RepID=UPI00300FC724
MKHSRAEANTVSVIIRFHDFNRLDYLDECLFSLAGQRYADIEAVVVAQNFSELAFTATKELGKFYHWQIKRLVFINAQTEPGVDARSLLINTGIRESQGRYLTFLDFDDTVYGNIYTLLVARLKETGTAICFAGTNRVDFFNSAGARHKQRRSKLFGSAPKLAFFLENQYPIHSYVIDTWQVEDSHLHFDENQSRNEDYAFLLVLLSNYSSDDYLVSTEVCDYYINMDGGNTIVAYGASPADLAKWAKAEEYVENVKKNLTIRTRYADLKKFHDWSIRQNTVSHLNEKIEELERRLTSAGAEISELQRYLKETLWSAVNCQPAPYYYIDSIERCDAQCYRVQGWCAGASAATPLVLSIGFNGTPSADVEVSQIRRPDVGEHLATPGDLFGFEIVVTNRGLYILKFLASDSEFYELSFTV